MAEAGLQGYDVVEWNGFLAPRGTPDAVLGVLQAALLDVMRDPSTQQLIRAQGFEPMPGSSADFTAWIQRESQKWSKVAKSINLTLD